MIDPYRFASTPDGWDGGTIVGTSGATFTLAEASFLATCSGGPGTTQRSIRSAIGRSSGKKYFELDIVFCDNGNQFGMFQGVTASATLSQNHHVTSGPTACIDGGGRSFLNSSTPVATGTGPYLTGDIAAWAVDFATGDCDFYWNNSHVTTLNVGAGLTLYPFLQAQETGHSVRLKLSAAQLTYTPPSGYSSWV